MTAHGGDAPKVDHVAKKIKVLDPIAILCIESETFKSVFTDKLSR
jgi:hypothetical protein